MEVLVKPTHEIEEYQNADGFVLPLADFSVDYRNYYTLEEIRNIVNRTKKKVFVVINKMIENKEIQSLKSTLMQLDKLNIKGIFFYDLSLIRLKQDLKLKIDLVWNNTHMVTNYYTCNYYYNKGCKYAYLSNEITLEEILEINEKAKTKLIFMLLGYPTVAFSKRKLVSNSGFDKEIKIKEPVSKQEYLVIENKFGTTFKYNKVRNNSSILKDLIEHDFPYIYLIEDDIEHNKFKKALDLTKNYLKNENKDYVNNMRNLFNGDTGFLYRKTIYKVKK
ncbi:MAG: U32 family peptidase [Bacilli bacterium]|nr:U32 family peptidase [Bacilli bacterium]